MPVETKLNLENNHHRVLISIMATFVEDYGYHPRELFELMDYAKKQMFHGLLEMHKEAN